MYRKNYTLRSDTALGSGFLKQAHSNGKMKGAKVIEPNGQCIGRLCKLIAPI
jgi:hypothetical protein